MATEITHTILLVEDDKPQRIALSGFLAKRGYRVCEAGSAAEAESLAAAQDIDLLLTDLRLGGKNGIELLTTLKEQQPDLEALVVTAYGTVDDAVSAMKVGAYDFLTKPVDLKRLELLVSKALERVALAKENRRLTALAGEHEGLAALIGQSPQIVAIKGLAAKAAASNASILILGESGTGKEVLARGIHRASKRAGQPFIAVNCSALPETLIESELFGHEKGAFTGAESQKKGRFELANGGTLFLDEIGEIPLQIQVKLLRVLQSGMFERVGGTAEIEVDVRIVAATNKNLEQAVAIGTFREDLFYRLNVIAVTLPPLRERTDDIPLLVNHFMHKYRDVAESAVHGIEDDALDALGQWSFPGNVRELENWIERALVLADGGLLTREDFPKKTAAGATLPVAMETEGDLEQQVAALESRAIADALGRNGGNKARPPGSWAYRSGPYATKSTSTGYDAAQESQPCRQPRRAEFDKIVEFGAPPGATAAPRGFKRLKSLTFANTKALAQGLQLEKMERATRKGFIMGRQWRKKVITLLAALGMMGITGLAAPSEALAQENNAKDGAASKETDPSSKTQDKIVDKSPEGSESKKVREGNAPDKERLEQARQQQARKKQARIKKARQQQARKKQARIKNARQQQARKKQARVKQARIKNARIKNARTDGANPDSDNQTPPKKRRVEKERFVDRDGDGIRDGRENRFRSQTRHRQRVQSTRSEPTRTRRMQRTHDERESTKRTRRSPARR